MPNDDASTSTAFALVGWQAGRVATLISAAMSVLILKG